MGESPSSVASPIGLRCPHWVSHFIESRRLYCLNQNEAYDGLGECACFVSQTVQINIRAPNKFITVYSDIPALSQCLPSTRAVSDEYGVGFIGGFSLDFCEF
jgi:hypothetical protein